MLSAGLLGIRAGLSSKRIAANVVEAGATWRKIGPPHEQSSENAHRGTLLRRGLNLELVTIAWMVLEAAISIGAGWLARSVALVAFGLDSVIELVSGGCCSTASASGANGTTSEVFGPR
jgi:hypothetical protein